MAPKVIATQDAVLSNYEVLQHVKALKSRYQATGRLRKVPRNLTVILDKVQGYLERPGAPLEPESAIHPKWSDATVARLVKHLKPYSLLKGEILMILNLRPASRSQLEPILEESATRFTPEQLDEIISIVYDQPTADGEYDEEEAENESKATFRDGVAGNGAILPDGSLQQDSEIIRTKQALVTQTSSSTKPTTLPGRTAQTRALPPLTSTRMTPHSLTTTMNAILKGKATHSAIDSETREKLINQWETTKAQFDQEPVEQWDKKMADLMTRLYGQWNLDSRLPLDDEHGDGEGGVDLEQVVGRELMMASQVDQAYDWMLEPPAGRVPRAPKKA